MTSLTLTRVFEDVLPSVLAQTCFMLFVFIAYDLKRTAPINGKVYAGIALVALSWICLSSPGLLVFSSITLPTVIVIAAIHNDAWNYLVSKPGPRPKRVFHVLALLPVLVFPLYVDFKNSGRSFVIALDSTNIRIEDGESVVSVPMSKLRIVPVPSKSEWREWRLKGGNSDIGLEEGQVFRDESGRRMHGAAVAAEIMRWKAHVPTSQSPDITAPKHDLLERP